MRALALFLVLACSACVVAPYPAYSPYYYAPYSQVAAPPQPAEAARQNCREFDTPVVIDGQQQQARGTACLQPDGTWRVEGQGAAGQPPQSYGIAP